MDWTFLFLIILDAGDAHWSSECSRILQRRPLRLHRDELVYSCLHYIFSMFFLKTLHTSHVLFSIHFELHVHFTFFTFGRNIGILTPMDRNPSKVILLRAEKWGRGWLDYAWCSLMHALIETGPGNRQLVIHTCVILNDISSNSRLLRSRQRVLALQAGRICSHEPFVWYTFPSKIRHCFLAVSCLRPAFSGFAVNVLYHLLLFLLRTLILMAFLAAL